MIDSSQPLVSVHSTQVHNCHVCDFLKTNYTNIPGFVHSEIHKNVGKVVQNIFEKLAKNFAEGKTFTDKVEISGVDGYALALLQKLLGEKEIFCEGTCISPKSEYEMEHSFHQMLNESDHKKSVSLRDYGIRYTKIRWAADNVFLSSIASRSPQASLNPPTKLKVLWQQALDKSYCDITFEVDGTVLPAHGVILASFSPHFKSMIEKSKATGNSAIQVPDTTPKALKAYLEYIYTDEIQNFCNLQFYAYRDLVDIIQLGIKYSDKQFTDYCLSTIKSQLKPEYYVAFFRSMLTLQHHETLKTCCIMAENDKKMLSAFEVGLYGISQRQWLIIAKACLDARTQKVEACLNYFSASQNPQWASGPLQIM